MNTVLYLHGTIETFHLSIESYYCNTQFHKQNNRFNSLRQFLKTFASICICIHDNEHSCRIAWCGFYRLDNDIQSSQVECPGPYSGQKVLYITDTLSRLRLPQVGPFAETTLSSHFSTYTGLFCWVANAKRSRFCHLYSCE